MSGTSVIRDIPCLVLLSEGVCPAVNGAEMNQHVRAYVKFILWRRNRIVISYIIIYIQKCLQSDWWRASQFILNVVQKCEIECRKLKLVQKK